MNHDIKHIEIPKIIDGAHFENLCFNLYVNNPKNENVNLNGRKGQSQDGVDIFGRNILTKKWFGIQCKVRGDNNRLTKKEISDEVNLALKFNPSLHEYCIITTLNRDANLQKIIRELNDANTIPFKIDIMFWEDICDLLRDEKNYNIFHQYYNKYFADNTKIGHAIGKLINLELDINNNPDTHYELMIGKIPQYKDLKSNLVDYYRKTYFIINFYECKMETWATTCFSSDIEAAFNNDFDRFRIAKWIQSIEKIDDLIYEDKFTYRFNITKEEHERYYDSIEDDE